MSVKFKDYYEALGVSRTASQDDIQRAFRKLAREFHPDRNKAKGAEDRFKDINEAYEVLKDPEKRKRYDALGMNYKAGQDFTPPPGFENYEFNFGQPGTGRGYAYSSGDMGGLSDFFQMLFGGAGPMGGFGGPGGFQFDGDPAEAFGGRSPPGHVEGEIEISVEDAYHGATKSLTLETHGSGRRPERKTYQVKIPAGTTAGTVIRLGGQGSRGGDILLKVKLAPHPRYRVEGHDLSVDLAVAPWEAALGAKLPVSLPDGEVRLTVPPGTSSGQQLRLRGKGLPMKSGRGDLLVEIKIVLPKTLTDEERQLFEKLAGVSHFRPRL